MKSNRKIAFVAKPDHVQQHESSGGFEFVYKFTVPDFTREGRTNKPYKIVHKEFLVWSQFALMGNIGGTMGLLLGFSFNGFIGWVLDGITKLWAHFQAT